MEAYLGNPKLKQDFLTEVEKHRKQDQTPNPQPFDNASGGASYERTWAMPTGDTFDCPPIGRLIKKYLAKSKASIDPFARNKDWATYTNDLNPETTAQHHLDSIEFLELMIKQGVKVDLVLFDPPYSPRQIKELYDGIGLKMGIEGGQRSHSWSRERSLLMQLLTDDGIVISCDWNSMGMGKKHGFKFVEGLLVCHGAGHNDTIITVEQRNQGSISFHEALTSEKGQGV